MNDISAGPSLLHVKYKYQKSAIVRRFKFTESLIVIQMVQIELLVVSSLWVLFLIQLSVLLRIKF